MAAQHLAIYGKGGVGTSTVTSNISAALAESGLRVIQIGCGSRNDSTSTLRSGVEQLTVLDALQDKRKPHIDDIAVAGYRGVLCIEAGDPFHAGDCAGHGIMAAISLLDELRLYDAFDPDVVLYDVPGEVTCGGFAVPIRERIAERAYVVTSSDVMSLYAANNIFKAVNKYTRPGGVRFGGVIANGLTGPFAESVVADFSQRTATRVLSNVPRSLVVMQCELFGKTVIEAAPKSNLAAIYRKLARTIVEGGEPSIPNPLEAAELKVWAREWGDRIVELETGVVRDGAAI